MSIVAIGIAALVFCYQNCSDLFTVGKDCSSDREKLLNFFWKNKGNSGLKWNLKVALMLAN